MDDHDDRLRYRLLTGPDDADFCRRVSEALADGYRLHGSPAITFDGERVVVAQAVVLGDGWSAGVTPVGPGGCGRARPEPDPAATPQPQSRARLTALVTAFTEAVTMLASIPTPQTVRPSTSHSTYAAACASPPEESACSW